MLVTRRGSWFGALVAGLFLAACESQTAKVANPPPSSGAEVGEFSLNLTLGTGYKFNEVGYDVSGNGFHKAATIDVAGSTTVSTIVGGIPYGSNYLLKLTAQEVDHKLTLCTGTATFSINSATTVPVPVHLTCRETSTGVPVPPWASVMLGALLLAAGAFAVRRRA